MTARPPFLDQLDHAGRQRGLEEDIRQRTERFRQPDAQRRSWETYQRTLAQRPHDWQVRFNFGNLLADFHHFAEAATQYREAVKLMPGFLPGRVALANALLKSGQKEEAVSQLQEAARLEPDYAPAREALASLGARR
jgi:predicted Zn-dependent protease